MVENNAIKQIRKWRGKFTTIPDERGLRANVAVWAF
jgi:hypothetical protein